MFPPPILAPGTGHPIQFPISSAIENLVPLAKLDSFTVMKLLQVASVVALLGASVDAGGAWWSYKAVIDIGSTDDPIVKHEGTPVGQEVKYEGC